MEQCAYSERSGNYKYRSFNLFAEFHFGGEEWAMLVGYGDLAALAEAQGLFLELYDQKIILHSENLTLEVLRL